MKRFFFLFFWPIPTTVSIGIDVCRGKGVIHALAAPLIIVTAITTIVTLIGGVEWGVGTYLLSALAASIWRKMPTEW